MAFYRLTFKNCILHEDSFQTWLLLKTFVQEESPLSCSLWGILVCPVVTHSEYHSWFIEGSVGLRVGGHGHYSGCVLRFVALTLKYGVFRGTTPALPTSVL